MTKVDSPASAAAGTLPPTVWETDASGMNRFQSREWYAYVGEEAGSSYGEDWLKSYHPEDRPYLLEEWRKARASAGAYPYDIEVRIRRFDGVYRWFRVHGTPVLDAAGAVVRWVGTCTDIDDRKRARLETERAAASSPGGLRGSQPGDKRARTRVMPLWTALSVTIVVAVLPVLIAAAMLYEQQERAWDAEVRRTLQGSARALSLALDREFNGYVRLLHALSLSSHIDKGDWQSFHRVASQVVDENDLVLIAVFRPDGTQVLNTARAFGSELPQPGLEEPQKDEGGLPPTRDISGVKRTLLTGRPSISGIFRSASAGRLVFTISVPVIRAGQVAYSLNAGVKIEAIADLLTREALFLGTPAGVVDQRGLIVAAFAGRYRLAVLRVTDRGVGIDPEQRSRIFDRYAQLGDQPGNKGLGVGLALTKSLVESHGGSVEVESAGAGTGASFVVRLPLAASQGASVVELRAAS